MTGPSPIAARWSRPIWPMCCRTIARLPSRAQRNKLAKIRTIDDLPLLYAATDAVLDPDLWQALGNPRPDGITHPNFEDRESRAWIRLGVSPNFRSDSPIAGRSSHPVQRPAARILRAVASSRGSLRAGASVHASLGIPHTRNRLAYGINVGTSQTAPARSQPATIGPRGKMTFTPDSDHAVLVLTYRRPEGQVRTEGMWI